MKKLAFLITLLVFSLLTFAQVEKYIPERPNPPQLVNDFAHMLTAEQKQQLERKLVAYDDSTSSQIVVVTVEDLHDYSAVEYSVALGRKWLVGAKGINNGVIVLVSTGGGAGNRDAFIATGFGLEGAIPDVTAAAILKNELIPELARGNYYEAFDGATDALIKAAAGEYKAPPGYADRGRSEGRKGGGFGIIKIIIAIIILIVISIGSGGGGGGGFMSRRGYRGGFLGPFILGSMLGGGRGGSGGGGWSGGGGGGGFGGFGGGGAGGKW